MSDDEKLRLLAPDLTKTYPRSPRTTLGGYVIAARCVDKARADLAGTIGEYHSGCPLDKIFLDFAGLTIGDLREVLKSGATDEEVGEWIKKNAKQKEKIEVIRWNNQWRDKQVSDLNDGLQEYLEDYIPQFVPKNRPVYRFFDVYDLEEQRI
jgi:hypothetical protein